MRLIVILLAIGAILPNRLEAKPDSVSVEKLLEAMIIVESGGDDKAIGDNGKALGCLQIWRTYFQDAQEYDKTLRQYKYEDVKKRHVAKQVVKAYWARYVTKKRLGREPTLEDYAMAHNGGCNWFKKKKPQTIKNLNIYWARVKKEMSK